MTLSREMLHYPTLINEKEENVKCPECGWASAKKITEVWRGQIQIRSTPEQTGGYFGDRPEEYGEGYTEWITTTIEEDADIECPHCSANEIGQLIYENPKIISVCKLIKKDYKFINQELFEYFAQHPESLYELRPREFEELLDSIFKNQGYQTEIGPGCSDGGVDLRLFRKDSIGEILTLVQAKRYKPEIPIRLEPVAALSALVDIENANRGLFVTTSRYLPIAQRFAELKSRRLVLATSEDVARWCAQIIQK
jgi:DNA-directed RNA polymerase subunit RPC12/RpoP